MLKKIQKLDIFWKKMIVFGALFVLAIPLLILVINNLSNRMTSIESQPVFNDVNIPSLEESGIGNLLDELNQLASITTSTFEIGTSTDDWQVYRNEEYKFEFKYPAEWPTVDIRINTTNFIIEDIFTEKDFVEDIIYPLFFLSVGTGAGSSNDFLPELSMGVFNIGAENMLKQNIVSEFNRDVIVGEKKGERFRVNIWEGGVPWVDEIILEHNDMLYVFVGTERNPIFEGILSSFQFIE